MAQARPEQAGLGGIPRAGAAASMDVSSMEDDQLYSIIMGMDPPPQPTVPAGMQERKPQTSVEDAKRAIESAKAAVGIKSVKTEEDVSNSEDDDFSPGKGRSGKNKRVMANRQSAQRSRLRKLQYIQDLEGNVDRLQSEICQIQPQLNFLREKYSGLSAQNHKLRDRVAVLLNEARYKDSVNNTLKEEIAHMLAKTQGAGEVPQLRPGGVDSYPPAAVQPRFTTAM